MCNRTSEDDMEVLSTVKDHLLQGLADDSEAIRSVLGVGSHVCTLIA